MSNLNTAITILEDLVAADPTITKSLMKSHLAVAKIPAKIVKDALELVRPKGVTTGGFKPTYHKWLSAERRTEAEAIEYVTEFGTASMLKNIHIHLLPWELSIELFDQVEMRDIEIAQLKKQLAKNPAKKAPAKKAS